MKEKNIFITIITGLGILLIVGIWFLSRTSEKTTTLEQSATASFEMAQGEERSENHDSEDGHDHREKQNHEEKEHKEGEEGHDEHEENVIQMTPSELKEFGVQLDTAGLGKIDVYMDLPGEVRINRDRLAHVVPRVSGVIRGVRKNIGDKVKKGEVMALLESVELGEAKTEYFIRKQQLDIAQTDLQRAQTIHDNTALLLDLLKDSPDPTTLDEKIKNLDMGGNRRRLISSYTTFLYTKETYEREKSLFKKKISSRSDLLKAENDFKSAQADYTSSFDEIKFSIKRDLLEKRREADVAKTAMRASERHLIVLGLTENEIHNLTEKDHPSPEVTQVETHAPIQGTVIEKHITLGEMVEKDTKIFVIADLGSVWVDLSVYRKDMPLIKKGMRVTISAGGDIGEAEGTISYIRPLVGEETRTALARIVLSNSKGNWRPGLFITGKIAVDNLTVPLLIPKTALQSMEDKTVVFVKSHEGFEARPVTIGQTSETMAEITSGLTAGEQYIAKGAFTVKAQMSKGGFESGHSH